MNGTCININQLFKILSMITWVGEVSQFLFSCFYAGKFNVYLCQSIHFSASGCSENCKPILARNNLEITDKHSAEL